MSPTQRRPPYSAALVSICLACWALALGIMGCRDTNSTNPPSSTTLAPAPVAANVSPQTLMEMSAADPYDAHQKLFVSNRFPSATACGQCHPNHYRQWSISQHAYAQMSPIFNAMSAQIVKGTNGTNGDFCIRCHTQVGMNLGESQFMSNIDRNPTSREGITCVVCHRLTQPYGKLSGRFPLAQGPITDEVYGPTGRNSELKKAIANGGLVTDSARAGRKVHGGTRKFFRITTSGFCGSCHDVTLLNGFRLEEAFSEYKHAPAALRGLQCQDCHMGREPGRALAERSDPNFYAVNYNYGPAAKVGNFETAPRMLTSHKFVGPDFSVLPPSLFPLHLGAVKEECDRDKPNARGLATIREWMTFDWKAGWGSDAFENSVADSYKFPPRWQSADDRYDARMIIDDNIKLLNEISQDRLTLLRNGYKLGGIVTRRADSRGIDFAVEVKSGTDGHNVPTGFDAERLVWLHVAVKDATGKIIKESGDLDPNGDVRDRHSTYVHNGELPLDDQLFSLQSHFVVRLQHGGEREQILATNFSPSPLPFLRPERMSTILLGRPNSARKQKFTIDPLGRRWADYSVSREQLTGKPPYTVTVQLKGSMVPVSLINEVRGVGFDFNLSPRTLAENMVAGQKVIWERQATLAP